MKKQSKNQKESSYKLTQQITTRKTQPKKRDPFKERGVQDYIDFFDARLLTRFLNEQGKLLPARITGATAKMQRRLTTAVKRARHLAIIPFVSEGTRH
jgi:small subunit ribosomal protein S18